MGLANVVAGIEAGVRSFDGSVSGLGGCPFAPGATGNICTEDMVNMLEDMGYDTRVDLAKLLAVARRIPAVVGHDVPGQVMKAGPDARAARPARIPEDLMMRAARAGAARYRSLRLRAAHAADFPAIGALAQGEFRASRTDLGAALRRTRASRPRRRWARSASTSGIEVDRDAAWRIRRALRARRRGRTHRAS